MGNSSQWTDTARAVYSFIVSQPELERAEWTYDGISQETGLSYDQVRRGYQNLRKHQVTIPGDPRSYQPNADVVLENEPTPAVDEDKEKVLRTKIRDFIIASDTTMTVGFVSDKFDVPQSLVRRAVAEAEEAHYLIAISEDERQVSGGMAVCHTRKKNLVDERVNGYKIRFGLVSDRHVASTCANLTALAAMYEIFHREGITTVLDTGNYIDGYKPRINSSEVTHHLIPDQIREWVKHTPQYPGMTTYFIAGDDHEGWEQQRSGFEIGKLSESIAKEMGRDDLKYLGYAVYDFIFENPSGGRTTVKLMHPGGGSCFDDEAEILTKEDGWIKFKNLTLQHHVATMSKADHTFQWQQPTHITEEPYSGPMYRFKNRVFDFRVTPNHKLWTRRYETARLRAKAETLEHPTKARRKHTGEWEELTAEEIATTYQRQRFQIPTASSGWKGVYTSRIEVPHLEPKNPTNLRNASQMQHVGEIAVEDAAELIAWYVTEGYADDKRVVLVQDKTVNPENHARICALLERIGVRYGCSGRNSKNIAVGSTELSSWLRAECGSGSANKYLPTWLKEQPVEILKIVLETMIEGDGWVNGASYGYKSISSRLRADVAEIAQKCGYGTCENKDTVTVRAVQNLPTLNGRPTIEEYNGTIHCCEVPNGLIYVRQNGKAFWSHNSYAISYKGQKIVEALGMMNRDNLPDVLCIGHYHKASYHVWTGCHVFQSGCFQNQTTFMMKKQLAAHVGGWIIELTVNDAGKVVAVKSQFYPFSVDNGEESLILRSDGTLAVE